MSTQAVLIKTLVDEATGRVLARDSWMGSKQEWLNHFADQRWAVAYDPGNSVLYASSPVPGAQGARRTISVRGVTRAEVARLRHRAGDGENPTIFGRVTHGNRRLDGTIDPGPDVVACIISNNGSS
jgi:hypothetical protein